MIYIFIILFIMGLIAFPRLRCALFHIPQSFYYMIKDFYLYVRCKKWQEWSDSYSGIFCFIGMFALGFCFAFGNFGYIMPLERMTRLSVRLVRNEGK